MGRTGRNWEGLGLGRSSWFRFSQSLSDLPVLPALRALGGFGGFVFNPGASRGRSVARSGKSPKSGDIGKSGERLGRAGRNWEGLRRLSRFRFSQSPTALPAVCPLGGFVGFVFYHKTSRGRSVGRIGKDPKSGKSGESGKSGGGD